MPGLKHEATHVELVKVIEKRITVMGLEDMMLSIGAATYRGRSSYKQGDSR